MFAKIGVVASRGLNHPFSKHMRLLKLFQWTDYVNGPTLCWGNESHCVIANCTLYSSHLRCANYINHIGCSTTLQTGHMSK
eukprot:4816940-Amphidinium_carterae.2